MTLPLVSIIMIKENLVVPLSRSFEAAASHTGLEGFSLEEST
jgi:hypothetical protein